MMSARPLNCWAELCLASDKSLQDYDASEDYLPVIPVCMKRLDEAATRALEWHYRDGLPLDVIGQRLGQSEWGAFCICPTDPAGHVSVWNPGYPGLDLQ